MSRENVEIVKAAFDAFGRGDWSALIGYLDPEIEWVTTGQFVGGQLYRGHAGVREFLDTLGGEFDEFHAEPENFAQAPDEVVVADTRVSGLGKRSGVPVELQFSVAVSLRDGKIVHVQNFLERQDALEAVGLRE
jgi:ketosteroid isomerase-like protein